MGCPIRPSNVRVYQFHHDGTEGYFLAGSGEGAVGACCCAGAGCAGAGCGCAGCAGAVLAAPAAYPFMTELDFGRACNTTRVIAIRMKPMKAAVVSLCRSVVAPRAPKAVCVP